MHPPDARHAAGIKTHEGDTSLAQTLEPQEFAELAQKSFANYRPFRRSRRGAKRPRADTEEAGRGRRVSSVA
jgi:hypothetical protein